MTLLDIPEHLRKFDWYAPHLKWFGLLIDNSVEAKRANLIDADLTRANLTDARLVRADITGANITNACLVRADITGANLTGANLTGANLTGANLTDAKGIISFGPVGTEGRIGYIVAQDDEPMVQLGCWWETLSKTIEILERERTPGYVAIVKAAALVLSEQAKVQVSK